MPTMDVNEAQAVAKAESGWDMDEDIYEVELSAVTDKDEKGTAYSGPKGPFWKVEVTFPDDANEGRYKRRKLYRNMSRSEDARGMMNEFLTAFGADLNKAINTDKLIHHRALIQVKTGEYKGQKRPEIARFLPLNGATTAGSDADGDDAANF